MVEALTRLMRHCRCPGDPTSVDNDVDRCFNRTVVVFSQLDCRNCDATLCLLHYIILFLYCTISYYLVLVSLHLFNTILTSDSLYCCIQFGSSVSALIVIVNTILNSDSLYYCTRYGSSVSALIYY